MKRVKKIFSRIVALAAAVLLTAALFVPARADARGLIDLTKKGEMTILYKYDDEFITGMSVHAYRIASISEVGEFTLLSPYDSFPVTDINRITGQDQWNSVINVIEPYIYLGGIPSTADTVTNANGEAVFTGLELGLYLVVSDTLVDETRNCTYTVSTYLISVPGLDESDNWTNPVYSVVARAKCERTENPKKVDYKLLKRWNDSGYTSRRPSSITVRIYRDGELFDTVVLESGNNWSYSWSSPEGYKWTFAEEIDSSLNYTVSMTSRGREYYITNTYRRPPSNPPGGDNPPPGNPPGDNPPPGNPPGDNPPTPENPPSVLGAIRELPQVLGARRLPQTGQLWWPLPILVIAGIFFIVMGIRKNMKSEE